MLTNCSAIYACSLGGSSERDDCILHGRAVLQWMNENIKRPGQSNLKIAQRLEGVKLTEHSIQCSVKIENEPPGCGVCIE
jgi:hypothetical protein